MKEQPDGMGIALIEIEKRLGDTDVAGCGDMPGQAAELGLVRMNIGKSGQKQQIDEKIQTQIAIEGLL